MKLGLNSLAQCKPSEVSLSYNMYQKLESNKQECVCVCVRAHQYMSAYTYTDWYLKACDVCSWYIASLHL